MRRSSSRKTYGSARAFYNRLRQRGQRCGRNRIARLMRAQKMSSQTKRRFRVSLTDSHHDLPIAPNRSRHTRPSASRDL
ncbi:MAG: IS3 family transposase [Limisphaerales bacterium]